MGDRYFENNLVDLDSDEASDSSEDHEWELGGNMKEFRDNVKKFYKSAFDGKDVSLYSGYASVAYMYFHLGDISRAASWIDEALKKAERRLRKRGPSEKSVCLITGECGVYTLHTIIHAALDGSVSSEYIEMICEWSNAVKDSDFSSNEFLYGRVSYIQALVLLLTELPSSALRQHRKAIIKAGEPVIHAIIKDGEELGARARAPLMWEWHDKQYYGGAHGVSGILMVLLNWHTATGKSHLSSGQLKKVKATVDWCLDLELESGNYPSSHGSTRDKLVQFCHGSPGFVMLYAKAFEVFNKKEYMSACESAASVVWERGLLRKGLSLCHGIAGNGYALLAAYRITGKYRWWYRAQRFAQYGHAHADDFDDGDNPYSLYCGLAGFVCYQYDVIGRHGFFPCFENRPTKS